MTRKKEKKEKYESKEKPKLKQRHIYAFSTDVFLSNKDFSQINHGWNKETSKALILLLNKIKDLPFDEKLLKGPNDNPWTMYLESIVLEDSVSPTYLKGFFYSTKDGLRTKLLNSDTNEISDNPKKPGQNEMRTTCFALRFEDGLFLLGDYGDNVVTSTKISEYLANFLDKFKNDLNLSIQQIQLHNLISKEFLEKLNSFKKLNQLELTIDTTQINGTDDAISTLNNETQIINQGKLVLRLEKKDKTGLSFEGLRNWVSSIMQKHPVIQGKIKGRPTPGSPRELRLKGINEKYLRSFGVDSYGEVLMEPLYDSIVKILLARSKIY